MPMGLRQSHIYWIWFIPVLSEGSYIFQIRILQVPVPVYRYLLPAPKGQVIQ